MPAPRVKGSIANGTSELRDSLDFYETPQGFTAELLSRQQFHHRVWEPTAGAGAISDVLSQNGYEVLATDINPQHPTVAKADFFDDEHIGPLMKKGPMDIVANPPFSLTIPFTVRAFELCHRKLAMVLPISGLNSSSRYQAVWSRLPVSNIYLAGRYQRVKSSRGVIPSQYTHIWVMFDKQHRGPPVFEWFPDVIYSGE